MCHVLCVIDGVIDGVVLRCYDRVAQINDKLLFYELTQLARLLRFQ